MDHGTQVTAAGIRIDPAYGQALDVLFDGARVWSFHAGRDGAADADGWLVPWPYILEPYLEGRTRVTIRPHVGVEAVYDAEVGFGESTQRVQVVDRHGNRLAVDKGGRLQRGFGDTDQATRDLIVNTVQHVLRDLHEAAGLDVFLSFGCLLGAVRDGKMIGHDADADVSFLSKHTHPYDIARETQATARTMRSLGYAVARMSSADFKIWKRLPDGRRCGIDVFGAYYFDGLFHMLPGVRGELPREALLPTSTVTLEGRELVAPARPEELLALTYGEGWRVPDPSFKYVYPQDLTRHMGGYWHGTRAGLRHWNEFYRSANADRVPTEPSPFAQWVAPQVEPGSHFLDIGHGNGRDSVWLAGQGFPVTGLEFSSTAQDRAEQLRDRLDAESRACLAELTFEHLNLNDLDAVLTAGARYAFDGRTRHLYARFLLDVLPAATRADFWRFASMVQRRGGLTFLEFRTHRSRGEQTAFGTWGRRVYLNPKKVTAEIARRGGKVVKRVVGRGLAPFENEDPDVCRLVVRWDR